MQIPVLLDRSRREPLTNQLVDQLRDAIRHARIRSGTRLPSSRRLSEQLSVSRNTVIRAYDTLIVEGYVESRPASGIFVAETSPGMPVEVTANGLDPARNGMLSHMPMPPLPLHVQSVVDQQRNRLSFDFFPGRPNAALFPVKTWRRLLQSALSHGGGTGLSQYGDPAGLPALRSAIADHLATTRGIAADPGRIVITNGSQEGISIAARLFLNHGTPSAIEDPCYQGAAFAFEATGSEITSVAVDFEGLLPVELPRRPTALLYVTPSHQYPTGHTLSVDRRRTIVAWARRYGCSPLQAIAATAPDCAIYLGTFSRTLGAGLRLGFMVVPEQLAGVVAAAKGLLNNGNPWLEQAALAEMMRAGSYAAHLLRSRARYKESRDYLLAALRRNFGDASVTGETAGLHLVWYLPPGVPNAVVVEDLARRARIGVYSFPSGGAYVARASTLTQRGLILGYAALTRKQIEQGIARLSDAIDDAIDDPSADVNALFVRAAVPPAPPAVTRKTRDLDSSFLRQPALAARRRRRRSLASSAARQAGNVMIAVSKIYRYPIKGLSAQPLSSVTLEADRPFPHDRIFALARPGAPIDRADPKWAKKGLFVMLMLDENLARVNTSLDLDSLWLTVRQGNQQVASVQLADAEDRAKIENFFWQLLPALPAAPVLVRSPGGHFMDKPDNVISLINLATVRSLEAQWGVEIDPLRFRANIYIDGARPWEEFDWVGSEIRIGGTVFAVDRKNGRCGATNVNPITGRRDPDVPSSLHHRANDER
jgi:GntR family transcriptional regulator / MocR family aminotransferase